MIARPTVPSSVVIPQAPLNMRLVGSSDWMMMSLVRGCRDGREG